jgi:hypothetical protein
MGAVQTETSKNKNFDPSAIKASMTPGSMIPGQMKQAGSGEMTSIHAVTYHSVKKTSF